MVIFNPNDPYVSGDTWYIYKAKLLLMFQDIKWYILKQSYCCTVVVRAGIILVRFLFGVVARLGVDKGSAHYSSVSVPSRPSAGLSTYTGDGWRSPTVAPGMNLNI